MVNQNLASGTHFAQGVDEDDIKRRHSQLHSSVLTVRLAEVVGVSHASDEQLIIQHNFLTAHLEHVLVSIPYPL